MKTRRILALVLACLMVFSCMSVTAFAEEEVIIEEVQAADASEEAAEAEVEVDAEAVAEEVISTQEESEEVIPKETPVEEQAFDGGAQQAEAEEVASALEEEASEEAAEEEIIAADEEDGEEQVVLAEVDEEEAEESFVELLSEEDYVELLGVEDWQTVRTALAGNMYNSLGSGVTAEKKVDTETGYTYLHLVPLNNDSSCHFDQYSLNNPYIYTHDIGGSKYATFKALVRTNITKAGTWNVYHQHYVDTSESTDDNTVYADYNGNGSGGTFEAHPGNNEWYVMSADFKVKDECVYFYQIHFAPFGAKGNTFYTTGDDGEATTTAYVDVAAYGFVSYGSNATDNDLKAEALTPAKTPDLNVTLLSSKGEEDGEITGLDSGVAYEMRTLDLSTYEWGEWTVVAEGTTEITGLASGAYEVRVQASDTNAASEAFYADITPDYSDFDGVVYCTASTTATGDGSTIASAIPVYQTWKEEVLDKTETITGGYKYTYITSTSDSNAKWINVLKGLTADKKCAIIIVDSIDMSTGSYNASNEFPAIKEGSVVTGLVGGETVDINGTRKRIVTVKTDDSGNETTTETTGQGGVVAFNLPNGNVTVSELDFAKDYKCDDPVIVTYPGTTSTIKNCTASYSHMELHHYTGNNDNYTNPAKTIVDSPNLKCYPITNGNNYGNVNNTTNNPGYIVIEDCASGTEIRPTRMYGNVNGYFKFEVNGGTVKEYRGGGSTDTNNKGANYSNNAYTHLTVNGGTIETVYMHGITTTNVPTGASVVNVKGGTVSKFDVGNTVLGGDLTDETNANSIIILQGDGLTDAHKTAAAGKATYVIGVEGGETDAVVKCTDSDGNLTDYTYDLRESTRVVGITIPEDAKYVTINGGASVAVETYADGYVPVSLFTKGGEFTDVYFTEAPIYKLTWETGSTSTTTEYISGAIEAPSGARAPDKQGVHTFVNWTVGGEVVEDIETYPVTGDTTFVATYTSVPHAESVSKEIENWPQVSPTDTNKSFESSVENVNGYDVTKIVPYSDTTANYVSIEGAGKIPYNTSTGENKTQLNADVYDYITVRYYYEPGKYDGADDMNLWYQSIYHNNAELRKGAIGEKSVSSEAKKWTYAVFDFSDKHGLDYSSQFHLRLWQNGTTERINTVNIVEKGAYFLLDKMDYFMVKPTVATVKFMNEAGTETLYEIDVLNGEAADFHGVEPASSENHIFVGWNTTSGASTATSLEGFTSDTTLYPAFRTAELSDVIEVVPPAENAKQGAIRGVKAGMLIKKLYPKADEAYREIGDSEVVDGVMTVDFGVYTIDRNSVELFDESASSVVTVEVIPEYSEDEVIFVSSTYGSPENDGKTIANAYGRNYTTYNVDQTQYPNYTNDGIDLVSAILKGTTEGSLRVVVVDEVIIDNGWNYGGGFEVEQSSVVVSGLDGESFIHWAGDGTPWGNACDRFNGLPKNITTTFENIKFYATAESYSTNENEYKGKEAGFMTGYNGTTIIGEGVATLDRLPGEEEATGSLTEIRIIPSSNTPGNIYTEVNNGSFEELGIAVSWGADGVNPSTKINSTIKLQGTASATEIYANRIGSYIIVDNFKAYVSGSANLGKLRLGNNNSPIFAGDAYAEITGGTIAEVQATNAIGSTTNLSPQGTATGAHYGTSVVKMTGGTVTTWTKGNGASGGSLAIFGGDAYNTSPAAGVFTNIIRVNDASLVNAKYVTDENVTSFNHAKQVTLAKADENCNGYDDAIDEAFNNVAISVNKIAGFTVADGYNYVYIDNVQATANADGYYTFPEDGDGDYEVVVSETEVTPTTADAMFNANGGAWANGDTIKVVSTIVGLVPVAPTENPTKAYYDFAGWTPEFSAITEAGATYTATYTAKKYTATFNAGEGTFSDGTSTYTSDVAYGEAITAPADPSRSGYVFAGWDAEVGNMDAEGKTFNAQWIDVDEVVVYVGGVETSGNGFTPDAAMATLAEAIAVMPEGGTIVVKGAAAMYNPDDNDKQISLTAGKTYVITSVYNGVDYRAETPFVEETTDETTTLTRNGAYLAIKKHGYTLDANLKFENINLIDDTGNAYGSFNIADGCTFTLGAGVASYSFVGTTPSLKDCPIRIHNYGTFVADAAPVNTTVTYHAYGSAGTNTSINSSAKVVVNADVSFDTFNLGTDSKSDSIDGTVRTGDIVIITGNSIDKAFAANHILNHNGNYVAIFNNGATHSTITLKDAAVTEDTQYARHIIEAATGLSVEMTDTVGTYKLTNTTGKEIILINGKKVDLTDGTFTLPLTTFSAVETASVEESDDNTYEITSVDHYATVKFVDGVTTVSETVYTDATAKIVAPADPTPAGGYEFAGWFDGETQYNANMVADKDYTFVAQYTDLTTEMAKYVPIGTTYANDKLSIEVSIADIKSGLGAYGFTYDTTVMTNPVVTYVENLTFDAANETGIIAVAADGVVQGTWYSNGSLDATTVAKKIFTITFDVTQENFVLIKADPGKYFAANIPTGDMGDYYDSTDGYWQADKWVDSYAYNFVDVAVKALEVTADLQKYNLSGSFKKLSDAVCNSYTYNDVVYSTGAVVRLYNKANSELISTFNETAETVFTSDNAIEYSFEVTNGTYYVVIQKNGYLTYTSADITVKDTAVAVDSVTLVAGDIKGAFDAACGDGKVDIFDFIRVIRGFNEPAEDATDAVKATNAILKVCVDIDENDSVTIDDLNYIKSNFSKTTGAYSTVTTEE